MAMNEEVMKEKVERAWAIIGQLSSVRTVCAKNPGALTRPHADTSHVYDVATIFRQFGQELVEIGQEMAKQADFADNSREAEDIAARAFAKNPGAFSRPRKGESK